MGQSKREHNKTIPIFGNDRKVMKEELKQIEFNKEKSVWQPKKTSK